MVSFQLVYSDGGVLKEHGKDFPNLYLIALLPFFLQIPTAQVQLVMNERFGEFTDDAVASIINFMKVSPDRTDAVEYFPPNYHGYFMSIYRSARGPTALATIPDV